MIFFSCKSALLKPYIWLFVEKVAYLCNSLTNVKYRVSLYMQNQNRTLLVLKYIWEHSDEEHQVTAKDILVYLEKNGISTIPRRVKADVALLRDFGFDIEIVHST